MNDNQVIIIIIGIGAVAIFMMMPASDKTEQLRSGADEYPWYPRAPQPVGPKEEDDPKSAKMTETYSERTELFNVMDQYNREVILPYMVKADRTLGMINVAAHEGPMRDDLRKELADLLRECQKLGDQWKKFLGKKATKISNLE